MGEHITVTVDARVRMASGRLGDRCLGELREEFTHANAKHHQLARMGLPTYSEPREIKTWAVDKKTGELSLPRGGMARVRKVLEKHGHGWEVLDRRCEGEDRGQVPRHGVELRDYQREGLVAMLLKENCIVRAPTGAGKSTLALAFASECGLATLVVVSNGGLQKQWVRRAAAELGVAEKTIGLIGGGKRRIAPLTVALCQSLAQRGGLDGVAGYFGAVVCDEVQLFAARTFFGSIDPLPCRYRIGVSASEKRKDKKEFLIHDVFGEVACDIDKQRLVDAGHVLDVEVLVYPTEFEAPWYGAPDPAAEVDGDDGAPAADDVVPKELDIDRLYNEMASSRDRNAIAMHAACAAAEAGEQVLVMSHRREHCLQLDAGLTARGVRSGFLIGGPDYAVEFARTREGLERGELRAGVGTFQAIGYGIDLPRVADVVCATPIAGNREFFNQVRGRVCRPAPGKPAARMHYLWDQKVFGVGHLKNLRAWARTVLVFHDGSWVPVREFIRERHKAQLGLGIG